MRYAVVNEITNQVENVVEHDNGEWTPPVGTFLVKSEECSMGDFWDKDDNDFYRSLSNLKPPESEVSKKCRADKFEAAKVSFKSKMLLVDPEGKLSSF